MSDRLEGSVERGIPEPETGYPERTRALLRLARESAFELRHEYIGTEHLLIALTRMIPEMFRDQGVPPEVVLERIGESVFPGRSSAAGNLPYTSRTKALLSLAQEEAAATGGSLVEPEHLLLAAIRAERSIAHEVLFMLGFDHRRAAEFTIRRLSAPDGKPAAEIELGDHRVEPRGEGQLRTIMPELPLDDVAAGVAWYRDQLGFSVNYMQDDIAVMDRDSVRLLLIERTERHRGIGSCYLYVARVDALHAELAELGPALSGPPVSQPWGLREFSVQDPEGNRLTFGQPLW